MENDRFGGICRHLPPSLAIHAIARDRLVHGDPDLRLLPFLSRKGRVSVDIGANIGVYTYYLRRLSNACHAFEPNPDLFARLRRTFRRGVVLHPCAVSDSRGEAVFTVPSLDDRELPHLGTIDPENRLREFSHRQILVETVPLDEIGLRNVGFIKIDVEGHERAVLKGAETLIGEHLPTLLSEIDERYHPGAVSSIAALLGESGYRGFFLFENRLRPVGEFDRAVLQNPAHLTDHGTVVKGGRHYINNFVFVGDPEWNCPFSRQYS
jgi:FkbM family methyltransferase